MKKIIVTSFLLLFFLPHPIYAGGVFATPPDIQIVPSETRALIIFDGHQEDLYLSPTFTFNPLLIQNFAWITAVPTQPQVEVIDQEIFIATDLLTQKNLTKNNLFEKLLNFDRQVQDYYPQPSYTRMTNLMSTQVYAPNDFDKLKQFLQVHGYAYPKTAAPLLEAYRQKNYYIILADINGYHIQKSATEQLTLTGAHALPIKITFPTDHIFVPLKLGSVQPDYDSQVLGFSFKYQTSSETILKESDTQVDAMLTQTSHNSYPHVPTNLSPIMIDLNIVAPSQVSHPNFQTVFANYNQQQSLDISTPQTQKSIPLPSSSYITRLIGYIPQQQLEDITLQQTANQITNATVTNRQKYTRIFLMIALTILITNLFYRKKNPETN